MVAPFLAAVASAPKNVEVLELKVSPDLSDSLAIVTRKWNCTTELLCDRQF